MGLVRRDEVVYPQKSDYRRNVNRNIGSNKLDNIPFVYTLQINPGEFKVINLIGASYTIPTGKKFLITYMTATTETGGVIADYHIRLNGISILGIVGVQNPAISISLFQPIEANAGDIISFDNYSTSEASVGGFFVEN